MFQKLKSWHKKGYWRIFTDTSSLSLIAFGVIALIVSWNGLKAIQSNYEFQKQIARLEQQNEVSKLENDNLKLKNEYYNTDEFLELSARRQFGLAAPGEKVYLIPEKVAKANVVNTAKAAKPKVVMRVGDKPTYQKNFQAWINFFLHRQTEKSP